MNISIIDTSNVGQVLAKVGAQRYD